LERAWESVRANRGIDRQTIADVERYGIGRLLDELVTDLKDGSYRPLAARPVFIPKPGRPHEQRAVSVPTVRDRVAQAALKTVIEPMFEADMLECSFGFRRKRSAHDALQVPHRRGMDGRRRLGESDVSDCFGGDPHDKLNVGDRRADQRPSRPEALARDVALRSDAGRGDHAWRDGTP
jgi:RNA-directed DNA polymerase